jgi:hypothetical protein
MGVLLSVLTRRSLMLDLRAWAPLFLAQRYIERNQTFRLSLLTRTISTCRRRVRVVTRPTRALKRSLIHPRHTPPDSSPRRSTRRVMGGCRLLPRVRGAETALGLRKTLTHLRH